MTQEDKTVEEIEAETAAIEEKLKAVRIKKAKKSRRPRGRSLVDIQKDQTIKMSGYFGHQGSAGYSGHQGPSLIERIEKQMDKRRKIMEKMIVDLGWTQCIASEIYVANKGRYEGLSLALSILRSSSIREEMNRSDERLGI